MRGRQQQVAKLAERIGADRVGLVAADPEMVEPLPGKDVEMVKPEIDHNLLQLARAVERTPDPRVLRLLDDDVGALAAGFLLLRGRFHAAIHNRQDRTVFGEKPRRVELQRVEIVEPLGQRRGLGDRFGVQLFVDVAVDADLPHMRDLRRGRTESDAVEHMDDLRVGVARRQRRDGRDKAGDAKRGEKAGRSHVKPPDAGWTRVLSHYGGVIPRFLG